MRNHNHLDYRIGKLPYKIRSILNYYIREILQVNPTKYIGHEQYLACFDKYCFIHQGSGKFDGATLLFSGKWIGIVIGNKPYLSPLIYEEIYNDLREFRAAIIVKEKGVKNFLYGNDILPASIIKEYEPTNTIVAVVDEKDYSVIGVAKPIGINKKVYKNIYDIGLFLRAWS